MKKQNMIRWIAGAAVGIACVGFGIHAYYRYEEREAAVQEMEARGQQENEDAEDQKKWDFDLEWKEISPEYSDESHSLYGY